MLDSPQVERPLDPATRERIRQALAQVPGIAAVWVFGSFARGTPRSESDVDFGIVLSERGAEKHVEPRWLGDLASRLEGAVGREVDVVLLDAQGPMLRHQVLREGVLVYDADPERRVDFESETLSLYLDFRPTFDLAARAAKQGFANWLEKRK